MPDTHNTKNFMAHGGNELVIGGKLTFLEGAVVEGLEGVMPKAENIEDSTATTVAQLKENFNTLLAALKTAGLMEADAEPEPEDNGDGEDGDDEDDGPEEDPENGGSGGDNGGGEVT